MSKRVTKTDAGCVMEDAENRTMWLILISLFQEIRRVKRPARMVGLSVLKGDFLYSMEADPSKMALFSLQGGGRL